MRCITALVSTLALLLGGSLPAVAADNDAATLFQQRCAACHTIGEGKRIGPDLHGVLELHPRPWLVQWIMHPDQMLAAKDPVAQQLLRDFGQVPMPNLGITEPEAGALLDYIGAKSVAQPAAPAATPAPVNYPPPYLGPIQKTALWLFLGLTAAIVIVFVAVVRSTSQPRTLDMHKAYGVRAVLFVVAAGILLVTFVFTIGRTPYAAAQGTADRVVYVTARQFEFLFSTAPIVSAADLTTVPTMRDLELPAGTEVEFRVTALDVNHNFALYGPARLLLAQTQAMPGYVNRLHVRLTAPGRYEVLCLEYCGAAHHLMQNGLTVK